jgi:hypothetical protein
MNLDTLLKTCVVAQKRTSKNKPFVFISNDVVIKGPYPEGSKRMERIKWFLTMDSHPPCLILPRIQDNYLVYPNLATRWEKGDLYEESFSEYQYHLMKDCDLRSVNLKDLENRDLTDVLYTWIELCILQVGDVNLRNTLYSETHDRFYIVDVDDTSSKDRFDEEVWFFNRNPKESKALLTLLLPFWHGVIEKVKAGKMDERREIVLKRMEEYNNIGKMAWHGMRGKGGNYTYSGHPFDVMISALQKYTRRSEQTWAVEVAVELYRMGELDPAPRSNLFNRVMVIAVEDIGVADINLTLSVISLLIDKKNRTMDNLVAVVNDMASPNTKKTRIMSHLRHAYSNISKSKKYGLVIHEDRHGLATLELFEEALSKRKPEMWLWYAIYLKETANTKIDKTTKPYLKSKTTDPSVLLWAALSRHLDRDTFLPLMNGYWFASEKSPYMMVALSCVQFSIKHTAQVIFESPKEIKHNYIIQSIQDYAIDMHTMVGKRNGKTRADFVNEGALVFPEDDRFIDPLLVEIYKGT